mmetsp:Transcript_95445/g.169461  ORF Transcript_95445/g.169461 Transcript_95445/m.169461 type:complete len:139 (-) Transcript_95445:112-528(-)|eukprot:CAMPEP_0197662450 /NCGR_PEP_ID=MMETSP1338-20131121/53514_1 /TAXON_ID=43686 ORGANISM="Pelagodinium beii, Strain RCC1491" /NCGR_SAMPLE_ID=MMETSP1338 /ASSEMBLY_ACC=CAM_ASM_000754 /LENGTH=138 /DNA_ID=CAMNT_0043240317 /DNA_START=63 /DNA_END=479 /DNA_ORIENTATION=+
MGGTESSCCSNSDATAKDEQKEISIQKEAPPGATKLPDLEPSVPAASKAKSGEYSVTVDRSKGERLGVDVDHQDGTTLLIEYINPGLIQEWNAQADADNTIQIGDRICEVNGYRNDVLQLVDECKKSQVLNMKILRAA